MYCPNCAASIDGVKFCRSCGANVSLVPQALTGQLPEAPPRDSGRLHAHRRELRRRERKLRHPSIDSAATSIFAGIGFIFAAFAVMRYMPGGYAWGWSFLIPGFSCIGKGVGEYLQWSHAQRNPQPMAGQPGRPELDQPLGQAPAGQHGQHDPGTPQISAPTTSELKVPPSITEHTTKHLERK